MTETIKYSLDDGIATLAIDVPGQSMNVINQAFLDEFEARIDEIALDENIKGAIITSAKPSFMAGADLRMLAAMRPEGEALDMGQVFDACFRMNRMLRQLETCGTPFVAAINGTALGGGLEIALACHHRLVADDPKLKLGLPEVMVGLLPGGGGTQRLPRLAGVQMALQYITTGRNLSASEAVGFGVFQEKVAPEALMERAREWLNDKPNAVQPWDKKGFKYPGGAGPMHPGAVRLMMGACAMAQDKTHGNYPAVQYIMSCIYEGSIVPFDTAIRIESKYFAKLVASAQSANMIRTLFINKTAAEKGAKRPADVAPQKTTRLGMLGAGMMGAGIAYVSARAGMDVVLLDRDMEAAERGKQYSEKLVEKGIRRRKVSREDGEAMLARIQPTASVDDLAGVDLIIEAVFEDREIKKDITSRVEAVIGDDVIFASNTSTLPITGLAENFSRPQDFIGLHFFSPVEKMPLVEIILGEKTGDRATAAALDYVRAIKKTPIVVHDSRGFYTSRCFGTYCMEGAAMLREGIKPALIENAGKGAGMPVGPLAVSDEVSLELWYKVMKQTMADMGDAFPADPADDVIELFVGKLGRLGRKAGKGFYDYPEGDKKSLWPGLGDHFSLADNQPSVDQVEERLLYRQAIEAVRCMAEGVFDDPETGDVGAIFGWGFAPWTGGPFSMIDTIGVAKFAARAEELADAHGDRFAPPDLLKEKAAAGVGFYG